MNQDDPFANAESDRTLIMPSPGSRQAAGKRPPGYRPIPDSQASPLGPDPAVTPSGLNPLLAAANPLLNVVSQLRGTIQHPDPSALRDLLAQNMRTFESRAKAAGVASEKVIAARYVLCTLLDETAASTPWGGSGSWGRHSLLVMFHNEASGGEKFFQLLSKLAENPQANRDLLELMYVCLALGFEGRYRVLDNGRGQLDALREKLAQMLKAPDGYERDLSPHWQPAVVKRSRLLTLLPLWVVFAACGLLLLGIYLSFSYSVNAVSDPIFAKIQSIRVKTPEPPPIPVPPRIPAPAPKPRLASFLGNEIRQGLVTVRDDVNKSVVTIRGDNLFPPGGAQVSEQYVPLLMRIADALNSVPGQVQVTGHTDNQPIRSARFPSNWHLSQERARSVMQLLAQKVVPLSRLAAEGSADSEPVAPNDTPANRARNRRVEISLFATPPGAASSAAKTAADAAANAAGKQ